MQPQDRELVDDEQSEQRARSEEHGVQRRPLARPGQQRRRPKPAETDELHEQANVDRQEADTQDEKDPLEKRGLTAQHGRHRRRQ